MQRLIVGRRHALSVSPLFAGPAGLFLLILAVYPMVEMVRMSLSDVGIANILRDWPPSGLDNFQSIADAPEFWSAFRTTLGFVGVVVVLSLAAGLTAAFLIRGLSIPAQVVQGLMVFVWSLPPVVNGTLWKFLFSGDGALNDLLRTVGLAKPVLWLADPTLALWSVAFVTAWVTVPFVAVVLKAGLLDIPREVVEAARMDGAGPWQVTRHITLPILRPVILVTVVLVIIYAFRSFDFIYVMTLGGPGDATTTLPFLGYKMSLRLFHFGEGAAIGVVALAFISILAVLYVRATRAETGAR